jgi:hypothetical protein
MSTADSKVFGGQFSFWLILASVVYLPAFPRYPFQFESNLYS